MKQSTLVAAAGEYYVLARLSLLGKIEAQDPRGVPNDDIVVSSVEGVHCVAPCGTYARSTPRDGAGLHFHTESRRLVETH